MNLGFQLHDEIVLLLKAAEGPETELEGWRDPVWTDSEPLRTHSKEMYSREGEERDRRGLFI